MLCKNGIASIHKYWISAYANKVWLKRQSYFIFNLCDKSAYPLITNEITHLKHTSVPHSFQRKQNKMKEEQHCHNTSRTWLPYLSSSLLVNGRDSRANSPGVRISLKEWINAEYTQGILQPAQTPTGTHPHTPAKHGTLFEHQDNIHYLYQ